MALELNHQKLLETLIKDIDENYPSQKNPTFVHMLGIPGSGKSTYAQARYAQDLQTRGFYFLDFDRVMLIMPGYKEASMKSPAKAFETFGPGAAEIGYRLADHLIQSKCNFIFDHGATPKLHGEIMEKARDEFGYRLEMVFCQCSLDTALKRVKEREKTTKRHVPEALVKYRYEALKDNTPYYQDLVDQFETINTEG